MALSALALLILATVVLGRSLGRAARESHLQQTRALDVQAYRLERRLRDPRLLELAPASHRFTMSDGRIVRDAGLERLDRPTPFEPQRELDVILRENLARVEAAGDPARIVEGIAALSKDQAATPRARDWLRMRLAWAAHRAGDSDRLREALHADFDHDPDARLSAILLRWRVDRESSPELRIPTDLEAALASASGPVAEQFVTRARESLGSSAIETVDLVAMLAAIELRRTVLRSLIPLEPELARAIEPVVQSLPAHVLLFDPRAAAGALVGYEELRRALDDDPRFALRVAPPSACPALERDLLAGRLRLSIASLDSELDLAQRSLLGIGAALALLCGVGSVLALRAQRAERAAARLQAEFITTVTHELKTPLSGIRLVAELLSEGHVVAENERAQWLRRLVAESARLGMLLDNVLDLGRFERGEVRLRREVFALGPLVDGAAGILRPLLERDGFELRVGTLTEALVVGDPQALTQVLMNLADNARKYGRSPVMIEMVEDADSVALVLSDAGDGVSVEEESSIFERFRRGRAHRDGSIPGVGLGLHLCRTIITNLGGTLTVHGARFTVRLPKARPAPTAEVRNE